MILTMRVSWSSAFRPGNMGWPRYISPRMQPSDQMSVTGDGEGREQGGVRVMKSAGRCKAFTNSRRVVLRAEENIRRSVPEGHHLVSQFED